MALAPDPFMRGPNRYRDLSAAELDQGNGGADAARSHEVDQWLANECAAADARSRVLLLGRADAGQYQIFTHSRLEHDPLCRGVPWRRRLGFEVAQRMFDALLRLLVSSEERPSPSFVGTIAPAQPDSECGRALRHLHISSRMRRLTHAPVQADTRLH